MPRSKKPVPITLAFCFLVVIALVREVQRRFEFEHASIRRRLKKDRSAFTMIEEDLGEDTVPGLRRHHVDPMEINGLSRRQFGPYGGIEPIRIMWVAGVHVFD